MQQGIPGSTFTAATGRGALGGSRSLRSFGGSPGPCPPRNEPLHHSQDQQPVALVAIVPIGFPGLDLQALGAGALPAVQGFQQAGGCDVNRVESPQLHAENLPEAPVVFGLGGAEEIITPKP